MVICLHDACAVAVGEILHTPTHHFSGHFPGIFGLAGCPLMLVVLKGWDKTLHIHSVHYSQLPS